MDTEDILGTGYAASQVAASDAWSLWRVRVKPASWHLDSELLVTIPPAALLPGVALVATRSKPLCNREGDLAIRAPFVVDECWTIPLDADQAKIAWIIGWAPACSRRMAAVVAQIVAAQRERRSGARLSP